MAVVGLCRFFCTKKGAEKMKLLDRFELADKLNVHPATVTKWRKIGLPYLKPNTNTVRFVESEVWDWIAKRTAELTRAERNEFYGK